MAVNQKIYTGRAVIRVDEKNIGIFDRLEKKGTALSNNEIFLSFKIRSNKILLGAESFFFQEGTAKKYDKARYGELRVDSRGTSLLIGLRDDYLKRINPN
jgi:uncharacterized membrane-anchored protein